MPQIAPYADVVLPHAAALPDWLLQTVLRQNMSGTVDRAAKRNL